MFVLAAFLWFAEPAPLDMPRAESYLVTGTNGTQRLEDRFDELDLWTSRAVLGRWKDESGRMLTLARLDATAPLFPGATMTRGKFHRNIEPLDPKKDDLRDIAISRLSPFDLPEEPSKPRLGVRGMKEVLYYQGTNETSIVCAFLPEKALSWYLAVWDLALGDDFAFAKEQFEDDFLAEWDERVKEGVRSELETLDGRQKRTEAAANARAERSAKRRVQPSERELLRADAEHSVTNFLTWHATSAPEFVVLDDLPRELAFVTTLTNEFATMRRRYAETVPTSLDVSNVLAVARIFKDRSEYLGALEDNEIAGMEWSAAYWSPRRRELVAYLPQEGAKELLKTIRHEAFHQYLSYACSMMSASPWFNEGYAQYFEDEEATDWEVEVDLDQLAEMLQPVMMMDYKQFYDGSSAERQLKYRMAWSIAYFLEKGAPKVRFQPFKDVKRRYVDALIRTQDMRLATAEAFGGRELLDKFTSEWLRFWKKM